MTVSIQDITAGDITEIHKLETALFKNPFNTGDIVGWLDTSYMIMRKVCADSTLAGYLIASGIGNESELYRIGVNSIFHRQGLARSLLQDYFVLCREQNIEWIFLEVNEENTGAIDLYKTCGFSQYALRPGYYRNGSALCLKKKLQTDKDHHI